LCKNPKTWIPKRHVFKINGNVKSLFDPSNTEINTVEDNMDKWVNYRGEVLLPPFSFISAESVAQSGNFDFENVSFRDPEKFSIIFVLLKLMKIYGMIYT
jgi:hypothetical protein